jgi:hypothetical protein
VNSVAKARPSIACGSRATWQREGRRKGRLFEIHVYRPSETTDFGEIQEREGKVAQDTGTPTEEILPPPPKKSCLDSMRNALAHTDEDGAYAARMDEWVAWETVEGAAPG